MVLMSVDFPNPVWPIIEKESIGQLMTNIILKPQREVLKFCTSVRALHHLVAPAIAHQHKNNAKAPAPKTQTSAISYKLTNDDDIELETTLEELVLDLLRNAVETDIGLSADFFCHYCETEVLKKKQR